MTPQPSRSSSPCATVTCTLRPSRTQRSALDATTLAFARACHDAVREGLEARSTSNAVIHRRCYYALRERHGLSANLTVRAIARAARELKTVDLEEMLSSDPSETASDLEALHESMCEIEYDLRVFSVCTTTWTASLSTVHGRIRDIPLRLTDEQKECLLHHSIQHVLLTQRPTAYEAQITLASA